MEIMTPPRFEEFETTAEWKVARARYFKDLPRREREQKVIETVRTEYVDRIVEVERIVEIERLIEAAPVDVPIPDFLRYDPLQVFLADEQVEGETDEATLTRLRREVSNLMALEKDGPLTPAEADRKAYLTANIKPGD
jgi:tRNA A-37 threonylcarbamoyl transferase component Bud32